MNLSIERREKWKSCRKFWLRWHFYDEWGNDLFCKFDAKKIVEAIAKSHTDCVTFQARTVSGYTLYNTQVGRKYKSLGDRDIVAEMVKECKKRGIGSRVYLSITWDEYTTMSHPEWAQKDNNGKISNCYVCTNNVEYKEYFIKHLQEIMAQHDIDGFWFDWPYIYYPFKSYCYCDSCIKLFKENTGCEPPYKPTWDNVWKQWIEFQSDSFTNFATEIRNKIKKTKPDWLVTFNYIAAGHDHPHKVSDISFSDIGFTEVYPERYGFDINSRSIRFLKGAVEAGKTFEGFTLSTNRVDSWCVKPLAQLQYELFTILVNGATLSVSHRVHYDGTVDEVAFRQVGKVFAEIKEKEKEQLLNGDVIKYVGLYHSRKTLIWYDKTDDGGGCSPQYIASFNGAYKALLELHIPTEIIHDENVGLDKLQQYPILFMANIAILSNDEQQIIKEYVKTGGTLIATYDTSLFDEMGREQKNFGLSDIFGSNFLHRLNSPVNYFQMPDRTEFSKGIDSAYYVPVQGQGIIPSLTTGIGIGKMVGSFYDEIQGHATKVKSAEGSGFGPPMNISPRIMSPAIVTNNFGQGKVIYIPFPLAASYSGKNPLPEHRTLLRNIIKANGIKLPIEVEAPLNVEIVICEQKSNSRYVVHLIALNINRGTVLESSRPGPAMMEEPALYKAKIIAKVPYSDVKLWGKDGNNIEKEGNIINILCNKVHEAVIIEKD
ncbi:MAG: alpha-L-fucosidase [Mariniphaga sp.]|nr:alpha-L-fucosidase [Mariniphaga sp.]